MSLEGGGGRGCSGGHKAGGRGRCLRRRGRSCGCHRQRCGSVGGGRGRLGCLGSAAAASGAVGTAVVHLRLVVVVGQVVGRGIAAPPATAAGKAVAPAVLPPSFKAVAPVIAPPPAVPPAVLPPASVAAAPAVGMHVLLMLALLLVHAGGRRLPGCTLSTGVWPVLRCCWGCRRCS